jgi:hypothetical protein
MLWQCHVSQRSGKYIYMYSTGSNSHSLQFVRRLPTEPKHHLIQFRSLGHLDLNYNEGRRPNAMFHTCCEPRNKQLFADCRRVPVSQRWLSAQLVLAAPTAPDVCQTRTMSPLFCLFLLNSLQTTAKYDGITNIAGQAPKNHAHELEKREAYHLNCTEGRTAQCELLGTWCAFGWPSSLDHWCDANCECHVEGRFECGFFTGCKVAQPGAETGEGVGEDGKATDTAAAE